MVRTLLAVEAGSGFNLRVTDASFIPHHLGGETMQVEIEQIPPLRLATVTHVGPYHQIGRAFERLGAIAGPAGLFAHPGAMMVATYGDSADTPEAERRSRAGISVPADLPLPPGVEEQRIPGGMYARHTHIGPFDTLGETWARFMGEAIPATGHAIAEGPAIEIYRSDMRTTPKEEYRTDLLVPVR